MKLSLNWIQDYIDIKHIKVEEIVNRLTMTTCEVDGYSEVFSHLKLIRCVLVTECKPHPDADRLKVCTVTDGKEKLTIVCGASNVKSGVLALLAPVGVSLPAPSGLMEIKKSKIRGVESQGMLCSAQELGIEAITGSTDGLLIVNERNDIFDHADKIKAGTSLASLIPLTDTIIEIDNKSITNRPDLWCHLGFAREIAAMFRIQLKADPLTLPQSKAGPALFPKVKKSNNAVTRKITIEQGAAKAYFGVAVTGIEVKPSPLWMQARLINIGQRPINNIVDASNYLMFEVGQPNHTFDAKLLKGDSISIVKTDSKKCNVKKFVTLDGIERELPQGTVLVMSKDDRSGKSEAVAIGGVMGGLNSGIAENTSELFLESATFYRETIRPAIAKLGLRTDSAVRFEKGQDPAKAKPALQRLIALISVSCPNLAAGVIHGSSPDGAVQSNIKVTLNFLQSGLGYPITKNEVCDILTHLNFDVKVVDATGKKKSSQTETLFHVKAPTYRSQYDVTIPEDIIEELGRLHGYDHIPPILYAVPAEPVAFNIERLLERTMKQAIALSGGYNETYNYSFATAEENRLFGQDGVRLLNPVQDKDRLRVSQIPGLLKQAASNQDRFDDVRLFEFGRIYYRTEKLKANDLSLEEKRISMVRLPIGTQTKGQHLDDRKIFHTFIELRSLVEKILLDLGFAKMSIMNYSMPEKFANLKDAVQSAPYLHPGCAVEFRYKNTLLGYAGILSPVDEAAADLKRPAVVADLMFDSIYKIYNEELRKSSDYTPPSIYPDSLFELSLLMDDDCSTVRPVQVIQSLNIHEIQSIDLLQTYRGEPIEAGKKSVSYRLKCSTQTETMSGERLQTILNDCVTELKKQGFPLR